MCMKNRINDWFVIFTCHMFSSYISWANLLFKLWFSLILHYLYAGFVPAQGHMGGSWSDQPAEIVSIVYGPYCRLVTWLCCRVGNVCCCFGNMCNCLHYIDVIMTTMASQITSLTVVYSIVYSGAGQSKHQSSASLAFVRGIHRDRWIPRTKGQ